MALRQAMSGPTPVRNSSTSPIGTIHLLKKGGPTLIRSPVRASDSVGNMVANSTKKVADQQDPVVDQEGRLARQRRFQGGARAQLGQPA